MTSPQPFPCQPDDEADDYAEGESVAEFDDQETYGDAPDDPEFGDPYDDTAFQYCFECNRSYPTEADLVDAYNTHADDEAPEVTSGSQVTFCPECMHDFLYPPSDAIPER